MKAQDLKNSILQLVIQGKLVPQDPNDEPADVLYERIQSEKQKLIKEGKIKKDKPLPAITDDEIPFPIPSTWKWVRFGSLFMTQSGLSFKKDFLTQSKNGSVRILRGGNILNNTYHFFENDIFIPREYITRDIYLRKNWIITPAVTSMEQIGKMALVDKNFEDCVAGGFVLNIIPNAPETISMKYMLFSMISPYFIQELRGVTNKSGQAFYNLSREKMTMLLLPLPPLAEQKRIVAKIEELEPLVKQYDKAETELSDLNKSFPEQLKKSILQYAIQGKLVPQDTNDETADILYAKIQAEKQKLIKEGKIKKDKPLPPITDDEVPFSIPPSWIWVRLGDCLDVRDGTHDTPKYVDTGVPLVTSKNLYSGFLDLSDVKYISHKDAEKINERSKVHKNDILFAMIGTIGNPVIVNVEPNFCIKNVALIKHNEFIDINYVVHFLTNAQNDMKKQAQGAVQSFVSLSFIRNFLIPLPPLAEQKRIVSKVDELIRYCEKLIRVKNN